MVLNLHTCHFRVHISAVYPLFNPLKNVIQGLTKEFLRLVDPILKTISEGDGMHWWRWSRGVTWDLCFSKTMGCHVRLDCRKELGEHLGEVLPCLLQLHSELRMIWVPYKYMWVEKKSTTVLGEGGTPVMCLRWRAKALSRFALIIKIIKMKVQGESRCLRGKSIWWEGGLPVPLGAKQVRD